MRVQGGVGEQMSRISLYPNPPLSGFFFIDLLCEIVYEQRVIQLKLL